MKIAIINGPNLNLLGVREPGIYGSESFEVFFEKLVSKFPSIEFVYFQSNLEGELINEIQSVLGTSLRVVNENIQRPNEIMDTVADINLAKDVLGWSPRFSLTEGLIDMLR